jgi:type III restriction enzyme
MRPIERRRVTLGLPCFSLNFLIRRRKRFTALSSKGPDGKKTLKPVLQSFRYPGFHPPRGVRHPARRRTEPVKTNATSTIVALDSDWEAKLAQSLEDMDEVISYVKNQNLGFNIPYAYEGTERAYLPDYIVRINDGKPEHLNLILEVTGERRKEKVAKVDAAQTLWIPAINNDGGFGRWAFLEITDPWNAKHLIREFLKK